MPTVTSVDTPTMTICGLGCPAGTEGVAGTWALLPPGENKKKEIERDELQKHRHSRLTLMMMRVGRGFGHHPERTADQNLLGSRDGFVQKGSENVPTSAIRSRFHALSKANKRKCHIIVSFFYFSHLLYHSKVALSFIRFVGAQSQLAMNVKLSHVSIVFAHLK